MKLSFIMENLLVENKKSTKNFDENFNEVEKYLLNYQKCIVERKDVSDITFSINHENFQ